MQPINLNISQVPDRSRSLISRPIPIVRVMRAVALAYCFSSKSMSSKKSRHEGSRSLHSNEEMLPCLPLGLMLAIIQIVLKHQNIGSGGGCVKEGRRSVVLDELDSHTPFGLKTTTEKNLPPHLERHARLQVESRMKIWKVGLCQTLSK
jgi:hypothetical protein